MRFLKMVGEPVSPSSPLTRVLVRALMFFGECPRVVLHKRRAKYGGDWLMGGVNLGKISAIQIRNLLFGYPSRIQMFSWYFSTRLAKKIVRGLLGGTTTPQTRKTGLFWTQKMLSACSCGLQEHRPAGAQKSIKWPSRPTCDRLLVMTRSLAILN